MANSDLQKVLLGSIGASVGDTTDPAGQAITLVEMTPMASSRPPGAMAAPGGAAAPAAKVVFRDRDVEVKDGARLMNALAALLLNTDIVKKRSDMSGGGGKPKLLSSTDATLSDLFVTIHELLDDIDGEIRGHIDDVLHSEPVRELERNWRGLEMLCRYVEQEDIYIDFLDVTREELRADFADHDGDIFGSALFRKVYIEEYDRYGGEPFATMVGLFDFEQVTGNPAPDVAWLHTMSKIAAAAHCPFVASAGPGFFGKKNMQEVAAIADLDAILGSPKYGQWDMLRDEDYAAYIGLTVPRYLARVPWGSSGEKEMGNDIGYGETVAPTKPGDENQFLWATSAFLFAKNLIRSYSLSDWAQHIRGPKGGGLVEGLSVFSFKRKDDKILYGKDAIELDSQEEALPPVEIVIPDFREYQFARNGLIALVHKKGEAVATFFSAQSIKKGKTFVEDVHTKNAHLVTNLAYTYSITQIAHYVKAMVREYIGSTADADYIQKMLSEWLGGFVTTVVNPDDLTLLYYPFKATSVTVEPKPGPFGWYRSVVSILPHLQFEGMDVELRLEASLGGK